VQFQIGAVLRHSNTPSLRVAGFEDEDENEVPGEWRPNVWERVGQGQVNYLEEFYSIVRANCESAEPTSRRTKMIFPESL
jgi:hypothetical protein